MSTQVVITMEFPQQLYYDKQTATVEQRGRWVGGKQKFFPHVILCYNAAY